MENTITANLLGLDNDCPYRHFPSFLAEREMSRSDRGVSSDHRYPDPWVGEHSFYEIRLKITEKKLKKLALSIIMLYIITDWLLIIYYGHYIYDCCIYSNFI